MKMFRMIMVGASMKAGVLAIMLTSTSDRAIAAPFCLEAVGVPPQCLYVDAAACQKEALRNAGRCVLNPQEVRTAAGPGAYCVVDSSRSSLCAYGDRASCNDDAKRRNAVCVPATPAGRTAEDVDPFKVRRPY